MIFALDFSRWRLVSPLIQRFRRLAPNLCHIRVFRSFGSQLGKQRRSGTAHHPGHPQHNFVAHLRTAAAIIADGLLPHGQKLRERIV